MINDLERFSVERLEELSQFGDMANDRVLLQVSDVRALARIALAAKSAGLVPVPDEFLSAQQNGKGLFELSEDCMIRLAVALSQQSKGFVIKSGWKLVPIEPTQDMVDAHIDGMQIAGFSRAYRDMLAAAPAPEEL